MAKAVVSHSNASLICFLDITMPNIYFTKITKPPMGDSDLIGTLLLIIVVLLVVFFILYYTCTIPKTPTFLLNVFKTLTPNWQCDPNQVLGQMTWKGRQQACFPKTGSTCEENSWEMSARIDKDANDYCCFTPAYVPTLQSCSSEKICKEQSIKITKGGAYESNYCCQNSVDNMNSGIYWNYEALCEQSRKHNCSSPQWPMHIKLGGSTDTYCCNVPKETPKLTCTPKVHACSNQYTLQSKGMEYCCKD